MNDDLSQVLKIQEQIDSDLISDRTKIDRIEVKLDTLQSLLQQLYDRLPRTEDKIADGVAKGIKELQKEANQKPNFIDKLLKTRGVKKNA